MISLGPFFKSDTPSYNSFLTYAITPPDARNAVDLIWRLWQAYASKPSIEMLDTFVVHVSHSNMISNFIIDDMKSGFCNFDFMSPWTFQVIHFKLLKGPALAYWGRYGTVNRGRYCFWQRRQAQVRLKVQNVRVRIWRCTGVAPTRRSCRKVGGTSICVQSNSVVIRRQSNVLQMVWRHRNDWLLVDAGCWWMLVLGGI